MQNISDIDLNDLKTSIATYVEKSIHDYLHERSLVYIKDMCNKNNLNFDEQLNLYKQYISCCNDSTNKICKGITKSGKNCTHKCPAGSFYCKKHDKNTDEIVNSYFP
jgi:hypothetical protein